MQLLYNSDSFAVLRFGTTPDAEAAASPKPIGASQAPDAVAVAADSPVAPVDLTNPADGYEIVDKLARKEIYLRGAVAESFQRGVKALVEQGPNQDALEAYFAGYTVLAQHPVLLH